MLRDFFYLLYLCSCLQLGLFLTYLCDLFYFHICFHDNYSYNLMNTDIHVLLLILQSMSYYSWMIVWVKNIIFKQHKFSFRVLLSICLIFCKFQPGIVYEGVAYKKRACNLFTPEHKIQKVRKLTIIYNGIVIKQHAEQNFQVIC